MTDSFVTQCPHCQTSFRVTHHQLSVARGVVRCGQCLQVFNAAKQLLEQNRAQAATTAPVAPTEAPAVTAPAELIAAPVQPPASSQDHWTSTSQALDDLDLDQALAHLERRQQPQQYAAEARTESLQAHRDDHNLDTPDEHLFGNATDEPEQASDALPTVTPPLVEAQPLPAESQPAPGERTEPTLSLALEPDDEPTRQVPTFALDEPEPAPGDRLAADEQDEHTEAGFSALDDDPHDEPVSPHVEPGERIEPGLTTRPVRRKEPLIDVVDDPLQLDWQQPKPNWGKRLLWGGLTLLAAGLLAFQYIWYHFDEMVRQDQYRPYFQQLCPLVGCQVPTRVDISRIKSSNLVVRSHPDFKGALIVDAILYNRAPFAQPFPLLELRFADLNGQLIASRRFKPSEYLSGELAGHGEMPSQTPIHIALDILDPGPKAVNYSLSFRSPE